MQLQQMPDAGLCLPTSFAMALEIPVENLLTNLRGWHDVIFPGLPEPLCWRGVHIQELIRLALTYGYATTPCEMYPQIAPPRPGYSDYIVTYEHESNEQAFQDAILLSRGVLTGVRGVAMKGVVAHAAAYDHGFIFDPNGYEYPFSLAACEEQNFYPRCAWRVDRIF